MIETIVIEMEDSPLSKAAQEGKIREELKKLDDNYVISILPSRNEFIILLHERGFHS